MASGRKKGFPCGHRGRGRHCHRCAQDEARARENARLQANRPATVVEAIRLAKQRHDGVLVFGAAVDESVRLVAPDAGPPEKIVAYLNALAELTKRRRNGPLGSTAVKWLTSKGVVASGESETILNSPKEQLLRTWDDGSGARRRFNLHLKPSEGTSPDRCVRIYFDYDENRGTTIIGWIGRHP